MRSKTKKSVRQKDHKWLVPPNALLHTWGNGRDKEGGGETKDSMKYLLTKEPPPPPCCMHKASQHGCKLSKPIHVTQTKIEKSWLQSINSSYDERIQWYTNVHTRVCILYVLAAYSRETDMFYTLVFIFQNN